MSADVFTIEDAAQEERERLEEILNEADEAFVDAVGRHDTAAAAEAAENARVADQRALEQHIAAMLQQFGRNAKLDVRDVDTGDEARDAYDRLVELIRAAGYDLEISNTIFNSVTGEWDVPPGDAAETFIIYERLGAVDDWIKDNIPEAGVFSPRTAEDVSTAQARLDEAQAALVVAQQNLDALNADPAGWVKGSGEYSEEDFPEGDERDGFVDATPVAPVTVEPDVSTFDQFGPAGPGTATVEDEEPAEPDAPLPTPTDMAGSPGGPAGRGGEVSADEVVPPGEADEVVPPGEAEAIFDAEYVAAAVRRDFPGLDDAQVAEAVRGIETGEYTFAGLKKLFAQVDPATSEVPDDPVDANVFAANFGYGARFLTTDPNDALFEVAELLRQAAAEGWDQTKLEQELAPTTWWQETVPRARGLQMLESTDPAAARVKIDKKADALRRKATSLGIIIDEQRLRVMARDYYIEEWTDYQANQNMLLEANWEPGQAGGIVEDNYRVVDIAADDWMVSHLLHEDDRDAWAERLALGDETSASMDGEFSRLAQSAFPLLSDRIGKGFTVKEILSPYREEIGRQLNLLDTNAIDFLNDPKYSPILYGVGGAQGMMTISDLGEYIRTDSKTRPLWEQTSHAKSGAQSFADFIAKKFGGLG